MSARTAAVGTPALFLLGSILAACDSSGTGPDVSGEREPQPASIEITPVTCTLESLGDTIRFVVAVRDASGALMPQAQITFASDHPDIVTVRTDGLATAMSVGQSTITATAGQVSGSATVTVPESAWVVAKVEVFPADGAVFVGGSLQLSVRASTEQGVEIQGRAVTWDTSDPLVATVDESGLLRGIGPGAVIILATVDEVGGEGLAQVSALPPMGGGREILSSGHYFTCGIGQVGGISCWGDGKHGQLGLGSYDLQTGPRRLAPPSGSADVSFVSVTAGSMHACGLSEDMRLYCWGTNTFGQLGTGHNSDSPVPVPVEGGHRWISVSAGWAHTCGVTVDDRGFCWGYNSFGELGDGGQVPRSATPVEITGDHRFRQLSAGEWSTCGVSVEGQLLCWGRNRYGEVGNGATTQTGIPSPVSGSLQFRSVSVGFYIACGLTVDNETYCWGNYMGLGTGSGTPSSVPVRVTTPEAFIMVRAVGTHACGLGYSGQAYCWGNNWTGQLGIASSSCNILLPQPVAQPTPLASVAPGLAHTCGFDNSGQVYCWGSNDWGEVGDGWFVMQLTPEPILEDPGFSQICAGYSHTCGITADGAALCWGADQSGVLGNGSAGSSGTPDPVVGGHSFRQISCGWMHNCGVTLDGAAYCWGWGSYGQLGTGATLSRSMPVLVSGGLKFGSVVTGQFHTCGLTEAGEAYCWGGNSYGEIGDGSSETRLVPTPVQGGLLFSGISAGWLHNCGLTPGGDAYCWGRGYIGELGDQGRQPRHSPTAVVGGWTYKDLALGYGSSCGLTTDGETLCWGRDLWEPFWWRGPSTPQALAGAGRFTDLFAGTDASCGVEADGEVYCWGSGAEGQLGVTLATLASWPHYRTAQPTRVGQFEWLALGGMHSCGIGLDGRTYCWGRNTSGQLGTASAGYVPTPAPVNGIVVDVPSPALTDGGRHGLVLERKGARNRPIQP